MFCGQLCQWGASRPCLQGGSSYHQPKLTLLVNTFRFHSTQDCRQSSISYCLLKRFSTRLQSVTNTIVHTARSPASPTSSPTWPTSSSSAFVSRTLLLSATTTAPTPATSPAAGQFLNDRATSQRDTKKNLLIKIVEISKNEEFIHVEVEFWRTCRCLMSHSKWLFNLLLVRN